MSELYSIQDTTLTALGDAVRSKVIGQSELPIMVDSFKIDYILNDNLNGNNNIYVVRGFTFNENIKKIKVKMNISYDPNLSLYQMPVGVCSGNFQSSNGGRPDRYTAMIQPDYVKVGGGSTDPTTYEYEEVFNSNSVSFVADQGNNFNMANVEVELTGLDENGNEFKYTPLEMSDKVNKLMTIPDEALNLTGNCTYRFAYDGSNWLVNTAGDKITTNNITDASYMFYTTSTLREIPFEINLANNAKIEYMFGNSGIKEAPKVNFLTFTSRINFSNFFGNNPYLRELPEWLGDLMEQSYNISSGYVFGPFSNMVGSCRSLRKIPDKVMKYMDVINPSGYYYVASYGTPFRGCSSLDELINITCDNYAFTSNQFSYYFGSLNRVKNITFATNEDSTPFTRTWKNQTIDLTDSVGYSSYSDVQYILNYNSGITADKEVKDDATYQALKNDPDWFTKNLDYSRYNHDSAVNTINSLPDCSASGGTNTIKFEGQAGALTDGGAINTLTEEEIAVATAKGWVVSFV